MASTSARHDNEQTPLLYNVDTASSTKTLRTRHSIDDQSDTFFVTQTQSTQSKPPHDEEAVLCSAPGGTLDNRTVSVGRIVSVLLIGSFISNADSSLLFATHPIIASEFDALRDSSWLMTSFGLAQAATQPLYGKLSDIYGRKYTLLFAYTLFGSGCALVGVGTSMSSLILGRIISGAGSSGMTTLVSILITDLVPLRDVARWRSYVNIVATTGRSIGGPLGGWLTDTAGWRWSFLGQVPLTGIAIVLISITLPSRLSHRVDKETMGSKFARIDFVGATFMTLSILSLLVPLEIGGSRIPWSSPAIIILFLGAAVFGSIFLAVEGWVSKEPIVPLTLLRQRDILVPSSVMAFQSAAQIGLMFTVPLYFQVTAGASNTTAGAHLFPAVAGNALGGVLSGSIIYRTGRYKVLILIATILSSTGYLLLILFWHGRTSLLESLYIFPGGFGMGIVQSALFISVQAAIDPAFTAIATSTLYVTSSIGFLAGMAGVSAVLQQVLRTGLIHRLTKLGLGSDERGVIIEQALADVHYIDKAAPPIASAVLGSYIDAFTKTHVLSLACSLTAFLGGLFIREYKIE
ncbi:MFS general substrate transporter [Pyrenochaeta sp. DS3sAY3a]|nr:MFS general substrate transporter [Pyrenochaeta sp. DS3sAY3a]